jgi:DNA-binding MarR family transcriptional regulator
VADDDARTMFRELTWTATAAHAQGDAAAAAVGQSLARWQVLDAFTEQPLTVPAAARRLRQSRQGTQRIVEILLRGGQLRRIDNPDHRTAPLHEVTPQGRRTLEDLDRSVTDWQAHVRATMSAQEVADLARLLRRLREAADTYVPPDQ